MSDITNTMPDEARKFLWDAIEKAPYLSAHMCKGRTREEMKQYAMQAFEQCLDNIMKDPIVPLTMMIAKVPIVIINVGQEIL